MSSNITDLSMRQLEQSVRVAALPAYRQIESFPIGVDVPFEIADDFGNWCQWVLNAADVRLTNQQRSCLISLDTRLNRMSGEDNADLWTEDALRSRPEWEEVRSEALDLLDLFEWPEEVR